MQVLGWSEEGGKGLRERNEHLVQTRPIVNRAQIEGDGI